MVFEGVALVGVVKGRCGFCWNLSFQNSYLYHCYLFLLQFFPKNVYCADVVNQAVFWRFIYPKFESLLSFLRL